VVATVVAILDCCFARVGNEEYARDNGSFGLTTLRTRHARISGSKVRLRYKGKGGKEHEARVDDRRIAHIVAQCREIPGQELFQYIDEDGSGEPVDSGDVNDYLRDATGEDFSAKDFRTWAATVSTVESLAGTELPDSVQEQDRRVVRAIDEVAEQLGNTRAVCRSCYVHPDVVDGYLDGSLGRAWSRRSRSARRGGLTASERLLLSFLRSRSRRQAPARAA
jgi:DNA topoisomerase-1